jgi:hypothetical protein
MKNSNGKSIEIYQGAEGIIRVYNDSLLAGEIDIICLSTRYAQVIGNFFDKEYSLKLFSGKIKTREILPDSLENRNDALKKDCRKNQVRFIKTHRDSESDMMIFGSKVALISYNPNGPFTLVVSDKEIVTGLRNQFDSIWQSLS